jgi:hypothetical protein
MIAPSLRVALRQNFRRKPNFYCPEWLGCRHQYAIHRFNDISA